MGISKEWRFVWYICGLFGGLLFKKDNARQFDRLRSSTV